MTVKFFPLFFKNTCKMSFVQVQAIYVGVPVLMTLMSGAGTWIAKRFGRVQTMVLLKVIGGGPAARPHTPAKPHARSHP